jgi:uncharacterized membrane protein
MEPKLLEEIRKHFKNDVIDFDWEPVRKQPKRYGIFYPIIGYVVSLLAVCLMGIGVFMWLFLIAGFILFFGGIYCANGIIGEYREIKKVLKRRISLQMWSFPADSEIGFNRVNYYGKVGKDCWCVCQSKEN